MYKQVPTPIIVLGFWWFYIFAELPQFRTRTLLIVARLHAYIAVRKLRLERLCSLPKVTYPRAALAADLRMGSDRHSLFALETRCYNLMLGAGHLDL